VYNPATGKWAATGDLLIAVRGHTATLLPSGRVLVAGGGPEYTAIAQLFDPAAGKWKAAGKMTAAEGGSFVSRKFHEATLLPTGKVLIVGGSANAIDVFSSAELYDPATGKWEAIRNMNSPRRDLTVTLLPNGKALVAGGWDKWPTGELSSAELFDPGTGK
jgi:hypothetical protein